jgi:flavin-dependent dehydrogenase
LGNGTPGVFRADICVYGGTSAGIAAAIAAARVGRSVVLVAPTGHLGGMSVHHMPGRITAFNLIGPHCCNWRFAGRKTIILQRSDQQVFPFEKITFDITFHERVCTDKKTGGGSFTARKYCRSSAQHIQETKYEILIGTKVVCDSHIVIG